jgi:hypothetical protein
LSCEKGSDATHAEYSNLDLGELTMSSSQGELEEFEEYGLRSLNEDKGEVPAPKIPAQAEKSMPSSPPVFAQSSPLQHVKSVWQSDGPTSAVSTTLSTAGTCTED